MNDGSESSQLRKTIWSLYDQHGIDRLKRRISDLEEQALHGEGTQSPMSFTRLLLLKERLAELQEE